MAFIQIDRSFREKTNDSSLKQQKYKNFIYLSSFSQKLAFFECTTEWLLIRLKKVIDTLPENKSDSFS
jgi:hypothetical protein